MIDKNIEYQYVSDFKADNNSSKQNKDKSNNIVNKIKIKGENVYEELIEIGEFVIMEKEKIYSTTSASREDILIPWIISKPS